MVQEDGSDHRRVHGKHGDAGSHTQPHGRLRGSSPTVLKARHESARNINEYASTQPGSLSPATRWRFQVPHDISNANDSQV
ncbi:hypothetical protein L543_1095 [Bordetella hinzii L60]|nr:hypothetical protein L543_1095 [Bordetella hinzii L60]